MISYKGFRAFYLGLNRWKVTYQGWRFDIICRDGLPELLKNIDRWEYIA